MRLLNFLGHSLNEKFFNHQNNYNWWAKNNILQSTVQPNAALPRDEFWKLAILDPIKRKLQKFRAS